MYAIVNLSKTKIQITSLFLPGLKPESNYISNSLYDVHTYESYSFRFIQMVVWIVMANVAISMISSVVSNAENHKATQAGRRRSSQR